MTRTLGKQPNAMDCFTIANVAEIMAWLAMIDAKTATANMGQYTHSATHRDNRRRI